MFFALQTTVFPHFIFLLFLHSDFSTDLGPLALGEKSGKQQKEKCTRQRRGGQNECGSQTGQTFHEQKAGTPALGAAREKAVRRL